MKTKPDRYGRKCCVCGRGFTEAEWEDRHDVHEAGCSEFYSPVAWSGCDCDLVAHAKHCPQCEPDKAFLIQNRKSVRNIVTRSWAYKHLNTEKGVEQALDDAFGEGNWSF